MVEFEQIRECHESGAAELVPQVDDRQLPRLADDPRRGPDHNARAAGRYDASKSDVAGAQHARSALFEHVKMPAGQNVLEIDRPARRRRFDNEEAGVAPARLHDELAVELGAGLDFFM